MKEFNLEEVKAGKPVCTRNGDNVRIISYDFKNGDYPIIGLVTSDDKSEYIVTYTEKGFYSNSNNESSYDLFMQPTIKTGWINLCRSSSELTKVFPKIYKSESEANSRRPFNIITTIPIQWEE
jgi:hypothetical protein